MKVRRIVANIATNDAAAAKRLYQDVLGLEAILILGWIVTYGNDAEMTVRLSVASSGGSGTMVPDLSIAVDDLDEALTRMQDSALWSNMGLSTNRGA